MLRFPTASRTYARSVHREVPELAQNTVFCNRMTVFFVTADPVLFSRRTASVYRISTDIPD
jgi:hypothetical protein